MSGSSIAAPDAAPWITDFLNAAYFRRTPELRDVDDLRLAFAILTTRWHRARPPPAARARRARLPPRVRPRALPGRQPLARAGRSTASSCSTAPRACSATGSRTPTPTTRGAAGASPSRRGATRAATAPRSACARRGSAPLTPARAPGAEQTWHTYPPVALPSADAVVAALSQPETWPDYATELGRFTPVRAGGLAGPDVRDRGRRGHGARPARLHARLRDHHAARHARRTRTRCAPTSTSSTRAWPASAATSRRPSPTARRRSLAFDLTTHEGHFMGRGNNRLVLYEQDGAGVRARGGHVGPDAVAPRAGLPARGPRRPARVLGRGRLADQSMLHQIAAAARAARRARPDGATTRSSSAAGPNGLAAAITLAEAGRSVLVLEAADAPRAARSRRRS